MTTDDRLSALSALLDREPVDPDTLVEALDDPVGRALLVDFVRVRGVMNGAFDEDTSGAPCVIRRSRLAAGFMRAALVLLLLALGAAGGVWVVERRESRPPTPTRIVQFVPGVDWDVRR